MKNITFTVVVTTHERPMLLKRALNSLIEQTSQNFELIIVDDSSKYIPPYEELSFFNERYKYIIRSGKVGPGSSRDIGVKVAEAPMLVFLDDDDSFSPNHFSCLAENISIESNRIYYHNFKVLYEERQHESPKILETVSIDLSNYSVDEIYTRNKIPNSCIIYPTDILKKISHDSDLTIYEDWDYLLKAINTTELQFIDTDTVNIHKSIPNAPENMRRGNSREDAVIETTLMLYKRYPAPTPEIRDARQKFFAQAGIALPIDYF